MQILIVIGTLLMLAACVVLYFQWRDERAQKEAALSELNAAKDRLARMRYANRGIAGKYRKAIEAHAEATIGNSDPLKQPSIDRALWAVIEGGENA